MELSIQERLKDLRVERGLTLEQLAEETKLSKSALGSYEADNGAEPDRGAHGLLSAGALRGGNLRLPENFIHGGR